MRRASSSPAGRPAPDAAGAARGRAVPAAGKWPAWVKPAVFVASLYPLARLVVLGFLPDGLGVNPVEFVTRSTGLWTLVFVCITLAITPLRRLTGLNALVRVRRMLGLYAFFYATLHFLSYIWFDMWFDLADVLEDIVKRPFIMVGFAAFVLLAVLAATSPQAMVRRLGRRWRILHRAVYAIGVLAILHFWWMMASKHNLALPKLYAAIMVVLLGWRVGAWLLGRSGRGGNGSKGGTPAGASSP
ncbi:protein-methionine-sulfoxide reductase heme-binding subunit MsrQ [Burkholderia sp. WAC0059]|uniref:protein-methionine-sulfoxide reductase heme-binding subunit MsrQ n=1 Tax=Burkholderia sp. WAC0059 TaxID=2066022 RepID=UPI000C7E9621|nr:protein-methionine-sulfoxide reductase heme-binding subunit MsrQ [Burkholderia sp. WAC0059]PLZ01338.1 protein-methionine-sulfoxide reductase heme-binding subunit MsrQ [Burkholderia sp. WAC0059]